LIVDEKTGRLVAGHRRLEALMKIKAEGKPRQNEYKTRVVSGWSRSYAGSVSIVKKRLKPI
jgi:hypothetical protein